MGEGVDAARTNRVDTLVACGYQRRTATRLEARLERRGVRVVVACDALRLAATRYPVEGGAAERYAEWLLGDD